MQIYFQNIRTWLIVIYFIIVYFIPISITLWLAGCNSLYRQTRGIKFYHYIKSYYWQTLNAFVSILTLKESCKKWEKSLKLVCFKYARNTLQFALQCETCLCISEGNLSIHNWSEALYGILVKQRKYWLIYP